MSEGGSGGPGSRLRRWAAIVALILLTSGVTVLALELSTARAFGWGMRAQLGRLELDTLALGTAVVALLVAGLFGLTGRLRRGIPLAAMAAMLVVAVNHVKIRFRSEPLYPSDVAFLRDAHLLVDSVGLGAVLGLVGTVLGVGAVTWLAVVGLGRLLRVPPAPRREVPRWVRWARIVAVTAAVGVVLLAAGFSGERSVLRAAFDRAGADWVTFSQNENFRRNGFLAGFLYNMPAVPMAQPEGYGPAAVKEVLQRYEAKARAINEARDPESFADTNVVVILGESFIDPLRLQGLTLAEDPLPYTRELMSGGSVSGTLHSVGFGGGTANVEFEVLTGMATRNLAHTVPPYQGLVVQTDHFPSILDRFGATHRTLGIHPFMADFYRRADAYRSFGFDEAKFLHGMRSTWKVSEDGYTADGAAYEELLTDLAATEEPVFANLITMQNHAAYADLYPDPIRVLGPAAATRSPGLSDYLRGLKHSDDALADLLAGLEALDEPTVVLFYGDHAPPSVVPDSLWDAQASDTARWETPWFVWSSEGIDAWQHEGLLSPTHLWNQLLGAVDAPVTPWDALLMDLELEAAQLGGRPGDHSQAEQDYTLLQYDMAVGAGHGTATAFSVPAP